MAHTFKSPQAMHTLDKAGAPGSGLSLRTAVPSVSRLLGSYCQFHPKAHLTCDPQKCCMHAKSLQSYTTLHDSMDCSPPGSSSVLGILQGRILGWVAISTCRGSSRPRDQTRLSYVYLHWQAGSLPLGPPGKPDVLAASNVISIILDQIR